MSVHERRKCASQSPGQKKKKSGKGSECTPTIFSRTGMKTIPLPTAPIITKFQKLRGRLLAVTGSSSDVTDDVSSLLTIVAAASPWEGGEFGAARRNHGMAMLMMIMQVMTRKEMSTPIREPNTIGEYLRHVPVSG
jgi:hypothetical protein